MPARSWTEKYGRWAVVTGASDGIGREMAIWLAKAGMSLVLVARRREILETLAQDLGKRHGIETRVVALDLVDRQAPEALAAQTGDLDVGVLVEAAGFGTSGNFLATVSSDELSMIDVNCRAVVALAHIFAKRFSGKGRGAIVLMSSLVAFQGVPRATTYAATKAFVQTFAEGLRADLSKFRIDVIASAPGPVRSGFESRADMRLGAAASPAVVARETLEAVGRRTTVRPGFLSKLLEGSLHPLPRWGRVRIMGLVMNGMTRHQDGTGKRKASGFA